MKTEIFNRETIVEVIKISKNKVEKKEMAFKDFLNLKNTENVKYTAYQIGFSQFKITNENS